MKTIKVIIDTNILVSAILRDRDPEIVIQHVVDNPEFEWVVSSDILAEYKAVLSRPKFRLTPALLNQWFNLFDDFPSLVSIDQIVDFPVDPGDAKFLACAICSDADFLITGDGHFEAAKSLMNTAVITVSMFKSLFYDID